MADQDVSKKHLLIPANALERISQAARELGWDLAYCTDETDDKVIGVCTGTPEYVAGMTGDDDGEHACEYERKKDGEGEIRH